MKKNIIILAIASFAFVSCSKESSNNCPTTSACGCSNKTKSECETDSCCEWTVGQGCDCAI